MIFCKIKSALCILLTLVHFHITLIIIFLREVDQFEFLTFMLGSMQKVDPEMMMDLKDLFEKLDVDGSGTLQKEDLVLMAQKKRDPWNLRKKK